MKKELFYRTADQTITLQLFLPEFKVRTKEEREFYANRKKILMDTCINLGAKISGAAYFQEHAINNEIKRAQKFIQKNGPSDNYYFVEISIFKVRELIHALGEHFETTERS